MNATANQMRERIGEQRSTLIEFYDFEIRRLTDRRTKIEDMFEILFAANASLPPTTYQKTMEKYQEIKDEEDKRTLLHSLFTEMQWIIEEQQSGGNRRLRRFDRIDLLVTNF